MKDDRWLIPGPSRIAQETLHVYGQYYGSGDLDPACHALYQETVMQLQALLGTQHDVVLMTGEGMLALWAGLKNVLKPGDKVLSIANGMFGAGIAEMAKQLGADVDVMHCDWMRPEIDFDELEARLKQSKPKLITAVHCDTPTALLNPITTIGALKSKYHVPLFYVDAVSSVGGERVDVDSAHIDICLGGSQKVLSCPQDMCFLSVSDRAWEIIKEVNYVGYDALQPFYAIKSTGDFPYTPHWQGIAALHTSCQALLKEGLESVYKRHADVAAFCRYECDSLGLSSYVQNKSYVSSTVTAISVPAHVNWEHFNVALKADGIMIGGNYGSLDGKVFRLGHMGTQADKSLVKAAINILRRLLERKN